MKIALFHNLPTGGAKRALWEHARELAARGHTLDAYVMDTAAEAFLPLAPLCRRVEIVPAPAGARQNRLSRSGGFGGPMGAKLRNALEANRRVRLLDDWEGTYQTLAARIDANGYDVAYVHTCPFLAAPFLLRALRTTPSVYYCHDTLRSAHEWAIETAPGYDDGPAPWGRRKVRGQITSLPTARLWSEQERRDGENARAAGKVLVNSWYSREAVLREYGINAQVCYLGVDSLFFSPDPAAGPREPDLVLCVGSITVAKRHDFVIEAVATIPEAHRPRLRILGFDPERGAGGNPGPLAAALARRAETRNVALEICHGTTDDALRDGYRRAGVVAFAPHLEPFGFIPLEAMACETPVVGVSEGGLRESIQNEQTGLLTDRDPRAFGAALTRVLTEKIFAARLGAAGRAAVLRDWTWARSAEVLERHLSELVAPVELPPMV